MSSQPPWPPDQPQPHGQQQPWGQQQPYGQPQPWGQPGWGPGPYAQPPANDGTAVAALVCAIASWVACPVVLAVVALFLASSSDRAIRESGGAKGGEGLNRAARIIAWVHLVVFGLIILAVVAVVVLAVAFGGGSSGSSTGVLGTVR
ncbi:hypothetical protein EV189_2201 [Motilibacter rhizosphaerae]|uniref:Interferon-induced transmembrane protein n=1 Tax=Motilibacter rhizosphaerae TaxID=598652 RepID=A0A4Q7NTB6_9ACTN|nr:hypothetical protein [Motilibacter rhizosphaerae]RZS90416.1 hypothetical protein EV189_2201 [Motilibacter rhizosphaerae]